MNISPVRNTRRNKGSKRRAKREKRSGANYRVSLKAIIRNQKDEVLMVRGIERTWTLPGGGIEHGETDLQALKRELLEEVAYNGDFEAHPVATGSYPSSNGWRFWIVYDVETTTNDFAAGVDADRVMFLDPRNFKNSTKPIERLVYEICVDRMRFAKISPVEAESLAPTKEDL